MITAESEAARQEREHCPVCRSPHRQAVERMRRLEQASYAHIWRHLKSQNSDISLRWIRRHFGRGHDVLSPGDETSLPGWIFEDENELLRYMEQYGYCRTIDDLCPHVPPHTVSSCEAIDHPECERFRRYTLRERVVDAESHNSNTPAATANAGAHALVEPLVVNQSVEVESRSGPRRGIYASSVLDLTSEAIAISVPTRLHELLPLTVGDRIAISYQGRVSKYVFETSVRGVRENRVEVSHPKAVNIASRRSPRIPLSDTVVRVVRIERGGEELSGAAANASAQGLRLVLASDLIQWERVRVTITLADGPLTAEGEVVRIEALGDGAIAHGIYFTGLTVEDVSRLQRLGG